ncbi:MAG: hypothetical protein CMJ34_03570 [Phycisphaerae bacterium]|nr:hypothetical protein [Phycisphaerae bacterium]
MCRIPCVRPVRSRTSGSPCLGDGWCRSTHDRASIRVLLDATGMTIRFGEGPGSPVETRPDLEGLEI